MPRISIGLPVFNGEQFLKETLDALVKQTYEDFELIISDNASTDATPDICRNFAAQDRRIRYYRETQNRGAAWNYNRVFALSDGEFFKWAAHDDICAATYLERCLEAFAQHPSAILCYPKTVIIDEYGRRVTGYHDQFNLTSADASERLKRYLLRAEGKECNAVFGLIRSDFLTRTPLIGAYNASDAVLLAYLALLGEFREIPEELFFRRDHPNTSIRANRGNSRAIAAWFDPARQDKAVFPALRKMLEYGKCVALTELSRSVKAKCFLYLLRWIWRRKARLVYESVMSPRHLLTKLHNKVHQIGFIREGERV